MEPKSSTVTSIGESAGGGRSCTRSRRRLSISSVSPKRQHLARSSRAALQQPHYGQQEANLQCALFKLHLRSRRRWRLCAGNTQPTLAARILSVALLKCLTPRDSTRVSECSSACMDHRTPHTVRTGVPKTGGVAVTVPAYGAKGLLLDLNDMLSVPEDLLVSLRCAWWRKPLYY